MLRSHSLKIAMVSDALSIDVSLLVVSFRAYGLFVVRGGGTWVGVLKWALRRVLEVSNSLSWDAKPHSSLSASSIGGSAIFAVYGGVHSQLRYLFIGID